MILVDLNLLLYAVNEAANQHERARTWWEEALSGSETVALPWTVILGFLRITTNRRIMPRPLTAVQAMDLVQDWLDQPPVEPIQATQEHWTILRELLEELGTAGNLTSDAHLAALAVEHGARLYSTDNDFSRFANVRWVNPLA